MSDMVDRVEMPGDGSVDNKEKGENKLAADIADTLDNNSIKEKLFKEFFKDYKKWSGDVFYDFRELSDKNLVDKNLIKSIMDDTSSSERFFDYLGRWLYLKHAEDIFDVALQCFVENKGWKPWKIINEALLLLYKDGKKKSVDDRVIEIWRLYSSLWGMYDGIIRMISMYGDLQYYTFPYECWKYLLNKFNYTDVDRLTYEESCGAEFVLDNAGKFVGAELLLGSIKMSKFKNDDQLKFLQKLLNQWFGWTLARKMVNNFSQNERLSVIESLLQYWYWREVVESVNSYKDINRQKVVDMLYDYWYWKLVEECDIMWAKKRDNK